ncbi:N-acetylmannosaminyltransferase [Planomicrobium soli]|uniref:N-acetylmannosaminyltransferase n=1 Tax=Planomicrobium soli TaxID=1176648 RepID=A0A2P8H3H0_9BACL|nr:WecB/TagA/CpsF family glycosyltransferase [Planomicrobium soli]PSL40758.1 N-acetylmannosaminyltransferase [Planomicrobium soli]
MKKFIDREMFLGTQNDLLTLILDNITSRKKTSYYALNPDCMLKYWKDEEYRKIINNNENIVYVDGMGIIFSQKILNLPVAKERIATTDLFPALMEEIDKRQEEIRIFLLGGKGDTVKKVAKTFSERYPGVQIVGFHHGYFDKNLESKKIIELVNQTKADILFVGFGNPVQEKWVNAHQKEIESLSIITCGGLFDYYSNNVKRAPLLMQKVGFEWLYRLSQEPFRLSRRYIFGNFSYLLKIASFKFTK